MGISQKMSRYFCVKENEAFGRINVARSDEKASKEGGIYRFIKLSQVIDLFK